MKKVSENVGHDFVQGGDRMVGKGDVATFCLALGCSIVLSCYYRIVTYEIQDVRE